MGRRFRRIGPLLSLAALLLVLSTPSAGARIAWCRADPVIKIDGRTVDIRLASHWALRETATGPAEIVITIPATSTGELLATDRGFGGHGYDVRFVHADGTTATLDHTLVQVDVYVPSRDDGLPLTVTFLPRSSSLAPAEALGSVNRWVTLRTG